LSGHLLSLLVQFRAPEQEWCCGALILPGCAAGRIMPVEPKESILLERNEQESKQEELGTSVFQSQLVNLGAFVFL
jgi:hypothetical protein